MIKNIVLIVLAFIPYFYGSNTPHFVSKYHELVTKAEEQRYINNYKNNENISVKAYVTSLQIKQAKYKTMPWSKLKSFNANKKKLENLILQNPNNVHLRYVRLVIQEHVPGFLNYKTSIKKDREFLKKVIQKKDSLSYLHTYITKNTSL